MGVKSRQGFTSQSVQYTSSPQPPEQVPQHSVPAGDKGLQKDDTYPSFHHIHMSITVCKNAPNALNEALNLRAAGALNQFVTNDRRPPLIFTGYNLQDGGMTGL